MPTINGGYLRHKGQGPDRDRYVHRRVMEELLAATHPLTVWSLFHLRQVARIPFDRRNPLRWEVDHCDGDRAHNCPCNLMLLQRPLHRGSSFPVRNQPDEWTDPPDTDVPF